MKKITTFEEHLTRRYGAIGTERRNEFEAKSKAFAIGELLKEARKEAKITQAELAKRVGTTKSYISRLENGKTDIQLGSLIKIVELGLGKKVSFFIK